MIAKCQTEHRAQSGPDRREAQTRLFNLTCLRVPVIQMHWEEGVFCLLKVGKKKYKNLFGKSRTNKGRVPNRQTRTSEACVSPAPEY